MRGDANSNEIGTGVGRSPGDADSATRSAEIALRVSGLRDYSLFPVIRLS